MDLQNKKLNVDNEQFIDDFALGPLGDSDFCYDWSANNIVVDHSGANQSIENYFYGSWFTEDVAIS